MDEPLRSLLIPCECKDKALAASHAIRGRYPRVKTVVEKGGLASSDYALIIKPDEHCLVDWWAYWRAFSDGWECRMRYDAGGRKEDANGLGRD